MKTLPLLTLLVAVAAGRVTAQELYPFSEPASNMPAKSIGIRLTNEGMFSNPGFVNRTMPEVMFGVNKKTMVHVQGFFSDMSGRYQAEGASLYAKYRFFSVDGERSHFRAAAFGRISSSNRNMHSEDINLEGDTKGWQGGLIFTKLIRKLALSGSLGYNKALGQDDQSHLFPDQMISYNLSAGYLLLPFVYKNYNQPNFNLYFEVLGKTNPANGHAYVDFAPALQMIINSRTRFDLGYRFAVAGDIKPRYTKNMYLARVEFNFFNVWK
jgi:hypothetical protein